MKYAHLDENNKILGWYSDDIHGTFIPKPNIEVHNEIWLEAINKNVNFYDEATKTFIIKDFRTLAEVKNQKTTLINNECNKAIVSGFKSSALGEEYFYYSTLEEQTTLNSLINLGFDSNFKAQKITLVAGTKVKGERKQYPHTLAQLRQILIDESIHIKTQINRKDELEILINNATTVEELELIEW